MIYIKFENQTYGEKAVRLLLRYNIRSVLRRNPNPNHKEGCNFALFTSSDVFKAHEIISSNGIPNLGVERIGDQK